MDSPGNLFGIPGGNVISAANGSVNTPTQSSGGWWQTNGASVVETIGNVAVGIWGKNPQTPVTTTVQPTSSVNVVGLIMGLAVVVGVGYLIYKLIKK